MVPRHNCRPRRPRVGLALRTPPDVILHIALIVIRVARIFEATAVSRLSIQVSPCRLMKSELRPKRSMIDWSATNLPIAGAGTNAGRAFCPTKMGPRQRVRVDRAQ